MPTDITEYLPSDILLQIMITCNFKELHYCKLVCKYFYKNITLNPSLFWFKHPVRFYRSPYNCKGCIVDDIITIFGMADIIIHRTRNDREVTIRD